MLHLTWFEKDVGSLLGRVVVPGIDVTKLILLLDLRVDLYNLINSFRHTLGGVSSLVPVLLARPSRKEGLVVKLLDSGVVDVNVSLSNISQN